MSRKRLNQRSTLPRRSLVYLLILPLLLMLRPRQAEVRHKRRQRLVQKMTRALLQTKIPGSKDLSKTAKQVKIQILSPNQRRSL